MLQLDFELTFHAQTGLVLCMLQICSKLSLLQASQAQQGKTCLASQRSSWLGHCDKFDFLEFTHVLAVSNKGQIS